MPLLANDATKVDLANAAASTESPILVKMESGRNVRKGLNEDRINEKERLTRNKHMKVCCLTFLALTNP